MGLGALKLMKVAASAQWQEILPRNTLLVAASIANLIAIADSG